MYTVSVGTLIPQPRISCCCYRTACHIVLETFDRDPVPLDPDGATRNEGDSSVEEQSFFLPSLALWVDGYPCSDYSVSLDLQSITVMSSMVTHG